MRALLAGVALLALPAAAVAQDASPESGTPAADPSAAVTVSPALLDIPLEELLTLETTSVAKKRQRVRDSAAAVAVITQEDIRRSAAATIPDLLRMVPGVEVGQTITGGTAVSIRGFNSRVSNSLLVMVDGRSVYVSTLSGVFWDQLMIPLGDIERIEVVRGPGSTLWGANASNGVINIITKHSSDSLGVVADARAGNRRKEASVSFGSRLSETVSLRVHGDVRRDRGLQDADGRNQSSYVDGQATGLRMDWEPNTQDAVTFQSEYNEGQYDLPILLVRPNPFNPGYDTVRVTNNLIGFNVLGRWTRRATDRLDWTLQAHYDQVQRSEFGGVRFKWEQYDVDFGLHWKPGAVHDFNFGLGARAIQDRLTANALVRFTPASATDRWLTGYVQDDISLIPDKLRLILGTKLEYNSFTAFEFQPNARLFFRPAPKLALWASASRAVRTPSRFERAGQFRFSVDVPGSANNPGPLPIYSTLVGMANRVPEVLNAFEAGLRADIAPQWSVDLATYFNDYRRLTTTTLAGITPRFVPFVPFPVGLDANVAIDGRGKARTYGAEASVKGQLAPGWKAELAYSHFDFTMSTDPLTGQPFRLLFPLAGSPRDQIRLHSSLDIGDALSIDGDLRHVTSMVDGLIPAYTNLDLRLTWRPRNGLELSAIGEGLLKARRSEFTQPQYPAPLAFVPRSVSAQLRYRF